MRSPGRSPSRAAPRWRRSASSRPCRRTGCTGCATATQRIRTDDRLAFPDGCSAGPTTCIRVSAATTSFDVYDFRSDNERRTTDSPTPSCAATSAPARCATSSARASRRTRYAERYDPKQAYNWVGIGNVFAPVVLPADRTPRDLNTLRDATTREFYVYDTMRLGAAWSLWLGARHTRLERSSERTDGSRAVELRAELHHALGRARLPPWQGGFAYVSAGSGVESEVVPNRPALYANAGRRSAGAAQPAGRARLQAGSCRAPGCSARRCSGSTSPTATTSPNWSERRCHRRVRPTAARRGTAGSSCVGRAADAGAVAAGAGDVPRLHDHPQPRPELVGKRTTNVPRASVSLMSPGRSPGVDGLAWTNRVYLVRREAGDARQQRSSCPRTGSTTPPSLGGEGLGDGSGGHLARGHRQPLRPRLLARRADPVLGRHLPAARAAALACAPRCSCRSDRGPAPAELR